MVSCLENSNQTESISIQTLLAFGNVVLYVSTALVKAALSVSRGWFNRPETEPINFPWLYSGFFPLALKSPTSGCDPRCAATTRD